jgi:hypothetical protein
MSKKEEIFDAVLFENNIQIIGLTLPKLINKNGLIQIKCYIEKAFFEIQNDSLILNPFEKLHNKIFEIHATTKQGSKIIFKDIVIRNTQYPSCKFVFLCLSNSIQPIDSPNQNVHYKNFIYSICVEGINLEFERTSKIVKKRYVFNEDETRTISMARDIIEISLNYFFRKKGYHFQIAIINDETNKNSVIIKFYGDFKLEYRYYKLIKNSFIYFLSYVAGNNLKIREESYQFNDKYYINEYSFKKIKKTGINEYLPIDSIHFRHEHILQDYFKTFENYLILDKHLKISEIIYLINQSKKVNIESSFFILLIAIEKLSDTLLKSDFIKDIKPNIIENKLFNELITTTKDSFKDSFNSKITSKDYNKLYSKLCNINLNGKTDNKIEFLMEFAEIKRNEDIDKLFPFLRNIAIHQGDIDFPKGNAIKNYQTLKILVNEIICNLLQFKGKRLVKVENKTNYISQKENYKMDYKTMYDI